MSYYINTIVIGDFSDVVDQTKLALEKEGFGILSEINIHDKFKEKLDIDFRRYKILGACNPAYAYKAIQNEDKVGLMLPCNVIVQELEKNKIEVSAVDPIASMMAIKNSQLEGIANNIKEKLKNAINSL